MPVTEVLMKPGNWALSLTPDAPLSVASAMIINPTLGSSSIVITPNHLTPIAEFSDVPANTDAGSAQIRYRWR